MRPIVYLKSGACALLLLLLASYIYLGSEKMVSLVLKWAVFLNSSSAPVAKISVDGKTVWEKPLLSTGFYDASGKLQTHYITLQPQLMQQILHKNSDILVSLGDGDPVRPQFARHVQVIRSDFPHQRIYFVADDHIDTLAMLARNDTRRGRNNVECLPPGLCETLEISSQKWGHVEGPYLRTDISEVRRGVPRGRWLPAPTTPFTVHSDRPQRVAMLFNVYALMPDQQITLSGSGIRNIKQPEVPLDEMNIGIWHLYPRSYIVDLDLHAGDNEMAFEFSKWPEPLSEGGVPLAALLSAIKIKPLN
jgi:hypothetical protein